MSRNSLVTNEITTVDDYNQSQVHNFKIRSTQHQTFKTHLAKEVIQEILVKYLTDKEYSQIEAEVLGKTIANEIKNKLKDQSLNSRYKLVAQVILGERHGAGTIVGARCIWDADTDTCASDQFLNVIYGLFFGVSGYNHLTVNHSENFVDPRTAANTQTIECVLSHLKIKVLRKMHDTTLELLPRHLIEAWWRSVNPQNTF